MFDGLGSEMNLIIDNLCTKFGTTVEELLPELCKFKVYQSVGYIAAFSILSLFVILCMIIVLIIGKKKGFLSEECIGAEVILTFILFMFLCGIAYQTYYLIIWKNAPTGAAVNYVIQQLKSR